MGRFLLIVLGLIVIACAALYFWPAKIDPAYWDEPEPPEMTGVLEPRGRLAGAEQIANGEIMSSEDVAIGPDGAIYTGQPDGRLIRLRSGAQGVEIDTVADVSNNGIFGLQWTPDGALAAMAPEGLYLVDIQTGEAQLLTDSFDGTPFGFGDDLDVANDGVIYFTDASSKWGVGSATGPDFLSGTWSRTALTARSTPITRTPAKPSVFWIISISPMAWRWPLMAARCLSSRPSAIASSVTG